MEDERAYARLRRFDEPVDLTNTEEMKAALAKSAGPAPSTDPYWRGNMALEALRLADLSGGEPDSIVATAAKYLDFITKGSQDG